MLHSLYTSCTKAKMMLISRLRKTMLLRRVHYYKIYSTRTFRKVHRAAASLVAHTITLLCPTIQRATIIKRCMLSRARTKSTCLRTNSYLVPEVAQLLHKSALGFMNIISNPQLSKDFIKSAHTHLCIKAITETAYNYVLDKKVKGGTAIIKAHSLAALEHQKNKQMEYPYNFIASCIQTPLLKINSNSHNQIKNAPVRTLVEDLKITHNATTHSYDIKTKSLLQEILDK